MSTKKSNITETEILNEEPVALPELIIEFEDEFIKEPVKIEELHNGYKVLIGTYDSELMAKLIVGDLLYKGFKGEIVCIQKSFEVNAGIFSQKQNAINMKYKLESYGYKPQIV